MSQLKQIDEELNEIQWQIKSLYQRQEELLAMKRSLITPIRHAVTIKYNQYSKTDFPWSHEMLRLLKTHWGIKTFRRNQVEIVNALMSRMNSFVIMPTGGGKSLTFQLPAIMSKGLTIVISPLISLIHDQVVCLSEIGIHAAALTSLTPKEEAKSTTEAIMNLIKSKKDNQTIDLDNMYSYDKKLKLIYITPERIVKSKLFMSKLEKLYKEDLISFFVIDEAHCCSAYGHDFRPDYKKLGILETMFPTVPKIALTATCPPNTRNDVRIKQNLFFNFIFLVEMLQMKPIGDANGTLLFKSPLHRVNLRYSVLQKDDSLKDSVAQITNWILKKHKDKCGIVYCLSKKDCENIAEGILTCSKGAIRVAFYHGDCSPTDREQIHLKWRNKKIDVVVATIAFGLGINQPDVRFVIHHTLSKSVEGYYQESGRAGRDGQPSDCLLLYRGQDISRLSSMMVGENNGLKCVYGMLAYANDVSTCRKILLERYFDDQPEVSGKCGNCDHCEEGFVVETYALDLLRIIQIAKLANEKLTFLKVMDNWTNNSPTKKISKIEKAIKAGEIKRNLTMFSKENSERIINHLLLENYLKEEFSFTPYNTFAYLAIATKGDKLLNNSTNTAIPIPKINMQFEKNKTTISQNAIFRQETLVAKKNVADHHETNVFESDVDDDDKVELFLKPRFRSTGLASSAVDNEVFLIESDDDEVVVELPPSFGDEFPVAVSSKKKRKLF